MKSLGCLEHLVHTLLGCLSQLHAVLESTEHDCKDPPCAWYWISTIDPPDHQMFFIPCRVASNMERMEKKKRLRLSASI